MQIHAAVIQAVGLEYSTVAANLVGGLASFRALLFVLFSGPLNSLIPLPFSNLFIA